MLWQPVFSSCPFLEADAYTSSPSSCCPSSLLSSCTRCLLNALQSTISGAQESCVPIIQSSIQSFLHLEFSASSKHRVSDCLRPCCHMLHSIVVSPLVRHRLSACCPLSMFRWKLPCTLSLGVSFLVERLSSMGFDFDHKCACAIQHSLSHTRDYQRHDVRVCIASECGARATLYPSGHLLRAASLSHK